MLVNITTLVSHKQFSTRTLLHKANMLKALFLDMDETLCDTSGANQQALHIMEKTIHSLFPAVDARKTAQQYLSGIYRLLPEYHALQAASANEETFRLALIQQLLISEGVQSPDEMLIKKIQLSFDNARTQYFDFFPGIPELLTQLKKQLCLIVITNGPEFSQALKIKTVSLENYVDHIIIGGLEKEQKPAYSIFKKALDLASCHASEVMHIGDSLSADIAGANQAGIRSVWVSHGQAQQPAIQPTFTIQSPLELEAFLRPHLS